MCLGTGDIVPALKGCHWTPHPWQLFHRKEDVKLSALCGFGALVPQALISGVCSLSRCICLAICEPWFLCISLVLTVDLDSSSAFTPCV